MCLGKGGHLSKNGLRGTVVICPCTVWSRRNAKKECIADAFSSRRETAAFPAQYVMAPWCPDPQSWWVHSEGQHKMQDLGGNMGRKKRKKDLRFRFMFLFDLLRCPKRVLSSCLWLSSPVMCTQPASSSDPFKTHALATCASPFGLWQILHYILHFKICFLKFLKHFLTWSMRYMVIPCAVCSDLLSHGAFSCRGLWRRRLPLAARASCQCRVCVSAVPGSSVHPFFGPSPLILHLFWLSRLLSALQCFPGLGLCSTRAPAPCHYSFIATGFISTAVPSLLLFHISLPDLPAWLFFCPEECLAQGI